MVGMKTSHYDWFSDLFLEPFGECILTFHEWLTWFRGVLLENYKYELIFHSKSMNQHKKSKLLLQIIKIIFKYFQVFFKFTLKELLVLYCSFFSLDKSYKLFIIWNLKKTWKWGKYRLKTTFINTFKQIHYIWCFHFHLLLYSPIFPTKGSTIHIKLMKCHW